MLISFEKVEYTTSILLKIFFSNKMSPKGLVPRLPSLENPFSIVLTGISDLA